MPFLSWIGEKMIRLCPLGSENGKFMGDSPQDKKMKITSTDTNMTTEVFINVDSEAACEFVVPFKLFSAIISKLPEDEMMIDYFEEKSKINIKCAGSSSEIICFKGEEYPKIKLQEGEHVIYLSKEDRNKFLISYIVFRNIFTINSFPIILH